MRAICAHFADIIKFLSILRFLGERIQSSGLLHEEGRRDGQKGFAFHTLDNKYTSRTNCLDHLTSRASAWCDDLITITYKNVQHVDPSLCYSCTPFDPRPSLLVCRISLADEWKLTSPGYWNFLGELYPEFNRVICKLLPGSQRNKYLEIIAK